MAPMGHERVKELFSDLVWPAAAGNVAWAFATVSLSESWSADTLSRLFLLLMIAFYLGIGWNRLSPSPLLSHCRSRVRSLSEAGDLNGSTNHSTGTVASPSLFDGTPRRDSDGQRVILKTLRGVSSRDALRRLRVERNVLGELQAAVTVVRGIRGYDADALRPGETAA